LSDVFPIQDGLKQDALSPFLIRFILKYCIRKVQENQKGLKLNGALYRLDCVVDVHLLCEKHNTMKVDVTKIQETNHNTDVANKSSKNVQGFRNDSKNSKLYSQIN
jgi:hypothetical protein